MPTLTEADTCRKYVLPKLYAAGWTDDQISEQRYFTGGRIVVAGTKVKRRPQKRADYLLRYARDFALAEVEAKKAVYRNAADGLQQAKEYSRCPSQASGSGRTHTPSMAGGNHKPREGTVRVRRPEVPRASSGRHTLAATLYCSNGV